MWCRTFSVFLRLSCFLSANFITFFCLISSVFGSKFMTFTIKRALKFEIWAFIKFLVCLFCYVCSSEKKHANIKSKRKCNSNSGSFFICPATTTIKITNNKIVICLTNFHFVIIDDDEEKNSCILPIRFAVVVFVVVSLFWALLLLLLLLFKTLFIFISIYRLRRDCFAANTRSRCALYMTHTHTQLE